MRVTFVSTYPPRACGLATFTQDLRRAVDTLGGLSSDVVAVVRNRGPQRPEVAYQLVQHDLDDYATCASWLNETGTDVVSLQHEFGIFGGSEGRHVLSLIENVRRPVVTTLHTVLPRPEAHYLSAMRSVTERSDRVVVTTAVARTLLSDVYHVDPRKVAVVPHGSPDLDPTPSPAAKLRLGLEGRMVLLTFGLLGPGKGIEHAIASLPPALEARPDLIYVILGATHPEVLQREGEAYRMQLIEEVAAMGLQDHVLFVDRYSDVETVWDYLRAADVYVSPYPNLDQICSGTLAYALGAGKPVVATPYLHARDVLANGRGLLAPHDDPEAFGRALATVCTDDALRAGMARQALAYGRSTVWPTVGASYARVLEEAAREAGPSRFVVPSSLGLHPGELPAALGYIRRLTDDTGIIQHAAFGVPDRTHGYSTDDAARALAVTLRASQFTGDDVSDLTRTNLAFLHHAQQPDGSFHNFLGYDRRFAETSVGEDTVGRAMWGLGAAVAWAPHAPMRIHARQMLERALHVRLSHPRAMAYSAIGLSHYLSAFPGADAVRDRLHDLATELVERLRAHAGPGWDWPADDLTYGNAVVPHAILRAGQLLDDHGLTESALQMLTFLSHMSFRSGHFDAVGNDGWWRRGHAPAEYDQQPIEAGYMADACAYAWHVTRDTVWSSRARQAAAWFYGANRLGACLFDVETGACFDGFTPRGVNLNQGAESAIACALALVAVSELDAAGAPAHVAARTAVAPVAGPRPAMHASTDDRGDGAGSIAPALSHPSSGPHGPARTGNVASRS